MEANDTLITLDSEMDSPNKIYLTPTKRATEMLREGKASISDFKV
jgi:hypothetical protein